jgi:hypothetical protein
MRIAGHSAVTVSLRYSHPNPKGMERAFERLEALNRGAADALRKSENRRLPATDSATLSRAAAIGFN